MPAFLVTFEIKDVERDRMFRTDLKKFGSYCPINNNAWAIVSNDSAQEIKLKLQGQLDLKIDKIFILKAGSEASWHNTYGEAYEQWLQKHILT